MASLDIELTDDEVAELEAPCTQRADLQGLSDDAELGRTSARLGVKPAGSSPVPSSIVVPPGAGLAVVPVGTSRFHAGTG